MRGRSWRSRGSGATAFALLAIAACRRGEGPAAAAEPAPVAAAGVDAPSAPAGAPAVAPQGASSPDSKLPRVSAALKAATDEDFAKIANLVSFKFRPDPQRVTPEGLPARTRPADVSGPADRPHYGVAGFHLFTPVDGVLGQPAQLVLGWQPEGVAGLDEASMAVYRWEGDDWAYVGGALDANGHTLTAQVTRLGQYTGAPAMPAGKLELPVVRLAADELAVNVQGLRLNTGRPVPDGTRYNVLALRPNAYPPQPGGEVLGRDVDPSLPYTQLEAVGGALSFRVRTAAAAVRLVVYSVDGTAYGEAEAR